MGGIIGGRHVEYNVRQACSLRNLPVYPSTRNIRSGHSGKMFIPDKCVSGELKLTVLTVSSQFQSSGQNGS